MKNFILKTIIISTAIIMMADFLLPDLPKIPKNEREKLFLLGFIQNPSVLWKLSVAQEEKDNIKEAITYMELSIGLLEMHGAPDKFLFKYNERLQFLQKLNTNNN